MVRYGLYPLLAAGTILYLWIELRAPESLGHYYGFYVAVLLSSMIAVEALHPMRREWRMTGSSRDTRMPTCRWHSPCRWRC